MKRVVYYCSGCKKEVVRNLPVARRLYKSFCEKAGKEITMTYQRWSRINAKS